MCPRRIVALVFALVLFIYPGFAQVVRVDEVRSKSSPSLNRDRGQRMLKIIKETLKTHYYDKNFKGIDIEARFKDASEKIKNLEWNADIFRVIAGVLLEFEDSHTRFYPPGRSDRVEYGFTMQMVGNQAFVTDVKKDSDAEKQGLKNGDRILKIGQYDVTRDTLWVLNYFIYQLEPLPRLPVTLADDDNNERTVFVTSSFKTFEERRKESRARRQATREDPYKCVKVSTELTACQLKTFSVERKHIEKMMDEAAKGSNLILDLRGNRGGYVSISEYLTGHFFDREVKIADMVTRKKTENRVAKPVKKRNFQGELVVLIDSNSASASEVFSRVIQIEKRGLVVGDVSAGAVMTSYNMSLQIDCGPSGFQRITPFGMNVTVADVIMSDGNRLEQIGVIPDRPVGPSPTAIREKNDPVLAYAAGLLGVSITSEAAGKFNFLFKKTEGDLDDDTDDPDPGD